MIKICHISQSAGGVETYILEIISNTNPNFQHTVICGDNGTLARTSQGAGAKVLNIKMVREISFIQDLLTLFKIIFLVAKIKPSIIHAHSGKGGIWGRIVGVILGIPTVFTPNAFSYLGQMGVKKKIVLIVEKIFRNKGFYLIGASNSECLRAISDVGWKEENVFNNFPNSITVNSNVRFKKKSDFLTIITVGRITYQKNPALFLDVVKEIVAQNSNIRFVWLGSGYADELSGLFYQKISSLKLHSKLIVKPWSSKEETLNMLNESDIYLSTSRYEGLPFVLLEAMDNFLPLVVSNVDGNKDVVEHEVNGFLCNSIDDYVRAILLLSSNESMRRLFGQKSKKVLTEKFNIEKNIKNLETIYNKLANGIISR
jgi:glycosyltransferase involved in cell wall biosynthesis